MKHMSDMQFWSNKSRFILVLVGIVALGGVLTVSILRERIVRDETRTISVTGVGKVEYEPDMATIVLGVEVRRVPTAEVALEELNSSVTKIINAIKKEDIPDSDISHQNYSLQPQIDYLDNIEQVNSYNASQQIFIKVRDIKEDGEHLARVIQTASGAGVNRIESVTFSAYDIESLKESARMIAIDDAKANAKEVGSALGVKLGKIVGWWQNDFYTPEPYFDGKGGYAGAGAGSPQLPAGTQEVIVEVSVDYLLK